MDDDGLAGLLICLTVVGIIALSIGMVLLQDSFPSTVTAEYEEEVVFYLEPLVADKGGKAELYLAYRFGGGLIQYAYNKSSTREVEPELWDRQLTGYREEGIARPCLVKRYQVKTIERQIPNNLKGTVFRLLNNKEEERRVEHEVRRTFMGYIFCVPEGTVMLCDGAPEAESPAPGIWDAVLGSP